MLLVFAQSVHAIRIFFFVFVLQQFYRSIIRDWYSFDDHNLLYPLPTLQQNIGQGGY
jgi:hypothetical protein